MNDALTAEGTRIRWDSFPTYGTKFWTFLGNFSARSRIVYCSVMRSIWHPSRPDVGTVTGPLGAQVLNGTYPLQNNNNRPTTPLKIFAYMHLALLHALTADLHRRAADPLGAPGSETLLVVYLFLPMLLQCYYSTRVSANNSEAKLVLFTACLN